MVSLAVCFIWPITRVWTMVAFDSHTKLCFSQIPSVCFWCKEPRQDLLDYLTDCVTRCRGLYKKLSIYHWVYCWMKVAFLCFTARSCQTHTLVLCSVSYVGIFSVMCVLLLSKWYQEARHCCCSGMSTSFNIKLTISACSCQNYAQLIRHWEAGLKA